MIALLNCYEQDEEFQKKYQPMFEGYFKKIMPDTEFKTYKVAKGEFPDMDEFDKYDGYVISGSTKSAFDDAEWILELQALITICHERKKKLLGLCFGHQLIAHTLGGKTERSKDGWGVGVRFYEVLYNMPWMEPAKEALGLIFTHQDQVTKLPQDAFKLAEDDFCPYQMFAINIHIFCMQGHPEFDREFAKFRLDSMKEKLGSETYENAVRSYNNDTDELVVGQWIKNFFG